MLLIAWKLEPKNKNHAQDDDYVGNRMFRDKFSRIDFLGAALMSCSILAFLMVLEIGGTMISWISWQAAVLVFIGVLTGALFYIAEKRWAKEPIFPLELLGHYDIVTSYLILAFQNASQTALMLYIPLYFEVTQNSSTAEAGAYFIPSIVGNTVGGLATGAYIKR